MDINHITLANKDPCTLNVFIFRTMYIELHLIEWKILNLLLFAFFFLIVVRKKKNLIFFCTENIMAIVT